MEAKKAKLKIRAEQTVLDEMDIYEENIVDQWISNDAISDVEEGFMKGYLEAGHV
jgi:hypothetical protein